jgi:hypothetical protein
MVLPDTAYLRTPMRSTHPLDVTAYNDDSDMANDKQFKVNTKFIATRGVKEYRASISDWID